MRLRRHAKSSRRRGAVKGEQELVQGSVDVSQTRLSDYLVPLRRHWLAMLLCLLLGLGLSLAYLQLAPHEYTASASVLVTGIPSDDAASTTTRAGAINLDTEAQLVTSTQTVDEVAKALHVSSDTATHMKSNVSVSVPPNTEILEITYVAPTPHGAVQGALAFANAYLAQRTAAGQAYLAAQDKALQAQITALNAQLAPLVAAAANLSPTSEDRARADAQINSLDAQLATLTTQDNQIKSMSVEAGRIVTQPTTPTSPSSPNKLVALAAGIVLGLLMGIGLATFRHRADDRIRTPEDLFNKTHVPVATVLATRPTLGTVTLLPAMSSDGRGFARLRNLVTTALEESGSNVALVAGVRHGGGQVAANLAAALAGAGEDVVLVCADVYASTAEDLLGSPPGAGLAEVVAGEASLESALHRPAALPGLRVLGPGLDPEQAEAVVQTTGARKLVEQLAARAAYVVIEVPATVTSPDAQTLAHVASLSVLAVEQGEATARDVVDACALLDSMRAPVLGGVLVHFRRDKKQEAAQAARPVPDADPAPVDEAPAAEPQPQPEAGRDEQNGRDDAGHPELLPPAARGTAAR